MSLLVNNLTTLHQSYQISINRFYCESNFPIEVRKLFANFIEKEIIENGLDEEKLDHHLGIKNFVDLLAETIENRLALASDLVELQQKMKIMLHQLKMNVENNHLRIFKMMKTCLNLEILYSAEQQKNQDFANQRDALRANFIANIKTNVSSRSNANVHKFDQLQSDFMFNLRQKAETERSLSLLRQAINTGCATDMQREQHLRLQQAFVQFIQNLQNDGTTIMRLAQTIEQNFAEEINHLTQLQSQILEDLTEWHREQKLESNKEKLFSSICLAKVQEWCEELASAIWNTYSQLKKVENLKQANPIFRSQNTQQYTTTDPIPGLLLRTFELLNNLMISSFVVEDQPSQSIRQTTKISSGIKVRHLCGHQLSAHMTPPRVEMKLIDEAMAQELMSNPSCKRSYRADVTAEIRALEYDTATKTFSTTFKNAQLKGFRRSEKKGGNSTHRVMEDKFCFYFETELIIAGLKFPCWTISHPVVITSHGSQDGLAAATILWDNTFGEFQRKPFAVPDEVSWNDLATILKLRFASCTGSKGRRLTDTQLQILKTKLDRVNSNDMVTWHNFSKELMVKQKFPNLLKFEFSFWSWCFEAMNLIENYLKEPWCDGSIVGIMDKETVERELALYEPGTFLVRFCDSILGAVSVSWVHEDRTVKHGEPYTENHLKICSLADRILNSPAFTVLYPTKLPKTDAFKIYCNTTSAVPPGYEIVPLPAPKEPSAIQTGPPVASLDGWLNMDVDISDFSSSFTSYMLQEFSDVNKSP